MGSLRLECPLCCTETFSTPESLRGHLLNMLDNLLCTGCGRKFETVRSLAEHVTGDCKVIKREPGGCGDSKDEVRSSLLSKALLDERSEGAGLEDDDYDDEEPDTEGEEEDGPEASHVAVEEVRIKEEQPEESPGEDMFFCSSCKVSFHHVDKHLEEFHQGQQVFLEDGVNTTDPEDTRQAPDPTFQTIKEEECIDVTGQLYTRRVVQIDKFWDKKQPPPPKDEARSEPNVQFFTVNNGTAAKITREEAVKLGGDSSVLRVFQCVACQVHFTRQSQYQSHTCNSVKFQCAECDASFPQQRSLSAHMRMHSNAKAKAAVESGASSGGTGEKTHVCGFCSTPFSTYKSLRLHVRMHDPIKSQRVDAPVNYGIMGEDLEEPGGERVMFTCTTCGKEYDEVYRHVHMESHSTSDNFDCGICNRKFYTASNLKMHMRVHNVGKTHTCSYCKDAFDEYKDLKEHLKGHLETRPYQCQYCSRRFIRPHEKVKHERIHTGEKPHICEVCGKSFRVSYCLTLHMRTHSGYRPYQCKECGKRFKSHSVYNHHLLIHSNVRKYKCPYCPKAFKTSVQLAGHKNTHTKPFTCTECNRPFASLYAVRSHMETHKQENNLKYNCFRCGASYARAFALRDHVRAHHEGEPWPDEMDELQENTNAATAIMQDDETADIEGVLTLEEGDLVEGVEMVDEATIEAETNFADN